MCGSTVALGRVLPAAINRCKMEKRCYLCDLFDGSVCILKSKIETER